MRKDHAAYLREWAADIRKHSGSSVDADQLDSTAGHIDRLEASLTEIRDIMPIVLDNYSRRVFAIAAETLEPDKN